MKILIVTDAWYPQVNGVVTTLENTINSLLNDYNDNVHVIESSLFKTFPTPYPDVHLAYNVWRVGKMIESISPETIHIATEGTLGLAARRYCYVNRLNYTTSYHTQFPEYIQTFTRTVPAGWIYPLMRWMHKRSSRVLVTTGNMKQKLEKNGFKNLIVWGRGADTELFNPSISQGMSTPRTLLYVGRVSIEKNLEAFLDINIPNTVKFIVGDGPSLKQLEKKYPNVVFMGVLIGKELAREFANASVFVFPSKTDTFGIVMLEANACGTPIAAYPVPGPLDIVVDGYNGYLRDDLKEAIELALTVDRNKCRAAALNHTWRDATRVFRGSLVLKS